MYANQAKAKWAFTLKDQSGLDQTETLMFFFVYLI